MLDLLLSIPKDVVRSKIISFLNLASLRRLDVAVTSHEYRQNVLAHVFADAEVAEERKHSKELIHWLITRKVVVYGMVFPTHVQDADLEAAYSALSQVSSVSFIKCLGLSSKCLENLFNTCGSLMIVAFEECTWLTDDTLYAAAVGSPNLQKLRIGDAPLVTDEGAARVASVCPFLGCIDFRNCAMIGDAFVRELCSCDIYYLSLAECPQVTEEALLALIAETGKNLVTFVVPSNERITDRTIQALAQYCPQLQELEICSCPNITDAGLSALVPICHSLTFLSADGCSFSSVSFNALSKSIGSQLLNLSISECNGLCDAHIEQITARSSCLEELNISQSSLLTNQTLVCIGKCLAKLQCLKVSMCDLFDYVGFAAVAGGCPNLTTLDVAFCEGFNNDCLHEIATHCPDLSDLYISDIPAITNKGIGYLAHYNTQLKYIDITCTSVTETAVIQLIHCCKSLAVITWDNRQKVTDKLQTLASQRKIHLILDTEGPEGEEEEDM